MRRVRARQREQGVYFVTMRRLLKKRGVNPGALIRSVPALDRGTHAMPAPKHAQQHGPIAPPHLLGATLAPEPLALLRLVLQRGRLLGRLFDVCVVEDLAVAQALLDLDNLQIQPRAHLRTEGGDGA